MNLYLISITFVFLTISMFAYLRIAKHYGILDIPNNRSSHLEPTIRGGGIIFPISVLLYVLLFNFSFLYFVIAVLLVSVISFIDDVYSISSLWRLIFQLLSALFLMFEFSDSFSIYFLLVIPVLIGVMNAYNFMDGINGITGGYSFITLFSLYVANQYIGFEDPNLIVVLILAVVIFSFFNFRKKAKCFAGDIGSISMAVILLFLIFKLIIFTSNPVFMLFLLLYGVDTGATLLSRLSKGANVLNPHREHLYQKLVDKQSWSHFKVSFLYVFIQAIVNFVVLFFISISNYKFSLSFFIILVVLFSYTFVKNKIDQK